MAEPFSPASQHRATFVRGANGTASPHSNAGLARIKDVAASDGAVRVIVGLKAPPELSAPIADTAEATEQLREGIERLQDDLVRDLRPLLRGDNRYEITRFDYIPYVAVNASPAVLEHLEARSDVISIAEEAVASDAMIETRDQINSDWATNNGFTGSGRAVVVIGTGVDTNHAMLSSKLVSAACYSTSVPPNANLCPSGASSSTAIGSGTPCTQSNCDHETHVAGIALGNQVTVGSAFTGVARDSSLISIKTSSLEGAGVRTIREADVLSALNRAYALRTSYSIASVNLSNTFATTATGAPVAYPSECDADFSAMADIVAKLKVAKIGVVAAAGNSRATLPGRTFPPACLTDVVAVSATTKTAFGAEAIPAYAMFNFSIDLLAPGGVDSGATTPNSNILSAQAAGITPPAAPDARAHATDTTYTYRSGTSMAAPHVAGAFAVLKAANTSATSEAIQRQLERTTTVTLRPTINDPLVSRIDVQAALSTTLTAPSQPSSASAAPLCSCVSEVLWGTSPSDTSHYELEGSSSPSFTTTQLYYAGPDTGAIVNVTGTTYFRVRACNGLSYSAWRTATGVGDCSCP